MEPAARLDARALRQQIVAAGGPRLELVCPLPGGAVGAWRVRWPDGHLGVLTWAPPLRPGRPAGRLAEVRALVELARSAGVPAPRYEAVIDVGGGASAVLQEQAPGKLPEVITEVLVDQMLELSERRRSLLATSPTPARPLALHLQQDGPGYCLHEPLRSYSPRSARLLGGIEAMGAGGGKEGADLVHFDYHFGNVLVAEDDPEATTAVVDWGGACAGPIGLDLALLSFDCARHATRRLEEKMAEAVHASVGDEIADKLWAHVALRLVDWTIRHGGEVEPWLAVGERRLMG